MEVIIGCRWLRHNCTLERRVLGAGQWEALNAIWKNMQARRAEKERPGGFCIPPSGAAAEYHMRVSHVMPVSGTTAAQTALGLGLGPELAAPI